VIFRRIVLSKFYKEALFEAYVLYFLTHSAIMSIVGLTKQIVLNDITMFTKMSQHLDYKHVQLGGY